jgi:hypothetical protein
VGGALGARARGRAVVMSLGMLTLTITGAVSLLAIIRDARPRQIT